MKRNSDATSLLIYMVYIHIKNILAPDVADPQGTCYSCNLDINNCSPTQRKMMQSNL